MFVSLQYVFVYVILHAAEDQFISNLFGKSAAILDVWNSYQIYNTWDIDNYIPDTQCNYVVFIYLYIYIYIYPLNYSPTVGK